MEDLSPPDPPKPPGTPKETEPRPTRIPMGWPAAFASIVHTICGAVFLIILVLVIAKGCAGQPITIP